MYIAVNICKGYIVKNAENILDVSEKRRALREVEGAKLPPGVERSETSGERSEPALCKS